MAFAIKAEVRDPRAKTFVFATQKTMYGGKHIAKGDTIFVFASENEGGQGLIAKGVVANAEAVAKKRGFARQTPTREHHRQTHGACDAAAGEGGAQARRRKGRRAAGDGVEFQILPAGDE